MRVWCVLRVRFSQMVSFLSATFPLGNVAGMLTVTPKSSSYACRYLVLVPSLRHPQTTRVSVVTRNTNAWLNVEAMQRVHDIINHVIARSELNSISISKKAI